MLYTFVTEFQRSTSVQQINADKLHDAVYRWLEINAHLQPAFLSDANLYDDYAPTEISGITNCWCLSFLDQHSKLVISNIVLTYENGN